MNIVDTRPKTVLVRADDITIEKAFRDGSDYFVRMCMNESYFNFSVKPSVTKEEFIWIFNVRTGTLGIVETDRMVEPVTLEVNVL